MILYVALNGHAGLAWGAGAAAALALAAVTVGVMGLTSSTGPALTARGQTRAESSAGWAGLLLPFLFAVGLLPIATALS